MQIIKIYNLTKVAIKPEFGL